MISGIKWCAGTQHAKPELMETVNTETTIRFGNWQQGTDRPPCAVLISTKKIKAQGFDKSSAWPTSVGLHPFSWTFRIVSNPLR
jgi:hypothetical protein